MALAVARDKTGKVYKIRELLNNKFEEEHAAEQSMMHVAHGLEAEEVAASEILMSCDEDDDPLVIPGEATMANIMRMLTSVTAQVGQLNKKMDNFQKGTEDLSTRMLRVEKKLGTTMVTVEQIREVITVSDLPTTAGVHPDAPPPFVFDPVDSEERLNELDYKLGTDAEYCSTLTKWLNVKIVSEDPDSRLHEAMELVFKREFLPKCSWKGRGKPETKIPISAHAHIIKLFTTLGSNRYVAITDAFVAKFFLKKLPAVKIPETKKSKPNAKSQPDSTAKNI